MALTETGSGNIGNHKQIDSVKYCEAPRDTK